MFPEAFKILLALYFVAALALALSYLRRRRMSLWAFALWGIFALLVPVLGPFLVIALRPGEPPGGRRPRLPGDGSQPARRSRSPGRFSPR
jgi:hypothetical protein